MSDPILNKVSALNAALDERDEEIQRLKQRHLKMLRGLARGDYEVAAVSDDGEVIMSHPTAVYEDRYSDHALDERLIDRIVNDPLEKQARIPFQRPVGWEERRREIWRSRLAQMRRVGIVISEAKP
jgi:hypothetical protein